MNVLVGCESSGIVRDAFIARGHNAFSCDLLPTERPGPHFKADVLAVLRLMSFDLLIVHPSCTHLSVSGARHFAAKRADGRQQEAIDFFMALVDHPNVDKSAAENPIGIMSTLYRKPDQIIQPWHFGHPEFKATCLWLKRLEPLRHTDVLTPPERDTEEHKAWSRIHRMAPGPNRWRERSRTYQGIADAMAQQWG